MLLSIFGAAIGRGVGDALTQRYRLWRKSRGIVLKPGKDGTYRDPLPRMERIAEWALIAAFLFFALVVPSILGIFYAVR